MRHTPKRPGPVEDYLGKPCAWCGDEVTHGKHLSLVVVEGSNRWEVFHGWCVEDRLEAEMSKLLGGR